MARAGRLAVVAVLLAVSAGMPLPAVVLGPGSVFDLAEVVEICAADPAEGIDARGFDPAGLSMPGADTRGPGVGMVAVAARPARGWQLALGILHPGREVVWAASLPLPVREYVRAEEMLFAESVHFAAAAALSLVRGPVDPGGKGLVVLWVSPSCRLAGLLHPGDVLEGYPTSFHLRRALRDQGVASVTVEGGRCLQLHPRDLAGLGLSTLNPTVPGLSLRVQHPRLGGSSAGLACALEVMRRLGKLTVPAGTRIAATGTVDPSGRVGRTGGVALKARAARQAGVDVLLVPAGQEAEALRAAPSLRVVGVSSLAEAAAVVQALADGGAGEER